MPLILAIDSDQRQAEQLAALVHARLTVDLVQATSAGEGLHALKDRVPDLILTSPLLSPFDDGVLDEYLRDLEAAAAHVQTLRIPVLSAAPKKKLAAKSLFSLGRKKRTDSSAPDGCDPTLFADEIALYLTRAAEMRPGGSEQMAPAPVPTDAEESNAYSSSLAEEETGVFETTEPSIAEAAIEPLELAPAHVAEPEYYIAEPVSVVADPEPILQEPMYAVEAIEELPLEAEMIQPDTAESLDVPAPIAPPQAVVQPAPKTVGTITSFEAALAAIRAAWATPSVAPEPLAAEPLVPTTASEVDGIAETTPVDEGTAPPSLQAIAPVEVDLVDLTGEIDALEPIAGEDAPPVADEVPASEPKGPAHSRRRSDKGKKRPDKHRGGRKVRTADDRSVQDEWGMFDPKQCGFSALVNKLDEVTDPNEEPTEAGTRVRLISIG